ncbi:alanine racemase [Cellvibrio polysaccharolyticus]|uniref:Alanine racemase n=1 Tax=Cellvibrio polysaccharolyticus TaxID=2082724 RepID=A0A928V1S0_9GAMM|nr:alanine racemase [Cellvibrio polysaccharolyticus]MBE8717173.1 alanine racemase [Cellvibrio polysaccharolyticus]
MNTSSSVPDNLSDFPVDTANAAGVLRIDLAALRHNYQWLKESVAAETVCAVVKADAYGLGAPKVVSTLYQAGCRNFFVAHLDEARVLLPLVPDDASFFVLNGLAPGSEPACAATGRVVPVCNSPEQFSTWLAEAERLKRRLSVVLQVDTGMSRLGFSLDQLETLAQEGRWKSRLNIRLVMSHLACADEPEHGLNELQLARFRSIVSLFPGAAASLSNSAGCLLDNEFHQQWVRPGIALYGVNPTSVQSDPFKPVASLHARVIQVHTVDSEATIGYGATATAEKPLRLATIAAGYADGWPRHLSNRGAAYWQSYRLPIVGRVSMDLTIVDISALPESALQRGDWVELIGPHQTVAQVAADADTIPYEILTQLGKRYYRYSVG